MARIRIRKEKTAVEYTVNFFYYLLTVYCRIIKILTVGCLGSLAHLIHESKERELRTKVNYFEYIKSPEWDARRKLFKSKVGGRCQVFPWLKAYASHHCHYGSLGYERWNIDCIVLSRSAHFIVHSYLTGSIFDIGTSEQNRNKWNKYPNILQRTYHCYARFVGLLIYVFK